MCHNLTAPEAATEYLKAKYQGRDDVMFIGGLLPCPVNHGFDEKTLKSLKRNSKRNQGTDFVAKEKLCVDCQAMQPWTSWEPSMQGKSTGGAPEGRRCQACFRAMAERNRQERIAGRPIKNPSRKVDHVNRTKECRGELCNGAMVPWTDFPVHDTYVSNDGSPKISYCKACNNHQANKGSAEGRKQSAKLTDDELRSRTHECPECGETKTWLDWTAGWRKGPGGSPKGACTDCLNRRLNTKAT